MGLVGALDRGQRRFPPVGLPLAVVYKFFDDQGAYLAAIITYYAFVAVFPMLLLASSVLGFVLQDNPELQQQVLDSALAQFPIVGDQLGRPEGLTGSTSAVVVGGLVALYGSLGLGTAAQNAMNVAWQVPRNSRPNPILLRLRSLLLLVVAGTAILGLTGLSIAVRETGWIGGDDPPVPPWLVSLVASLLLALMLTFLFRVAAARDHPWWYAAPGALFVALMWQVLQVASTAYVERVLVETSSMNQTFGLVLGLMGLIFLAAVIAVLGIELNVVITRRLWPRALLTPFTDGVELTPADERAYAGYAKAQRHKGFEQVVVVFDKDRDRTADPDRGVTGDTDDGDPSASR